MIECDWVGEKHPGVPPFDSMSFPLVLESFGSMVQGLETDCLR